MLLNKKKFTLLSVLIGILVSIIFSAIYVLFFAGSEQKLALDDAVKVSQARQQQVQEFINFADHNINTLVHAVDFNNLAFHQNNSSFQAARKTLKVLINGVPDMAQIRLIDENGMEQIRFDRLRTNDQVVEATGPALQDKSKRYYFLDCINQSQSNRCYSVIDLNVENGAVEVPYVPTLRVSYLVKNLADKPFVLVINYYMAPFLQKLVEDSRYLTILADNLGNSVFSNYPDYQWSRQIKTQKGLQQIPEFSGYFEKFKVQNLLQTDDFVSRKLDVPIRDGLYLVYFFDPLLKQKTQNNQILFLLVISALTMILVFLLSLVYYRFLLGKRTINQIRSQEKLYSATFNNSAIGIAHIDLNGYILRANPVFCEFLHMAQPKADSINLFKLQNAEDNAKLQQQFIALSQGKAQSLEKVLAINIGPDKTIYLDLRAKFINDTDLNEQFILIACSDISHRIQMEKDLQHAIQESTKDRAKADRANSAKSEFLAHMSHEVRTPLSGVIGLIEMLLETKLTAYQTEHLQHALKSSKSLLYILNDILDYSKIEARKLDIQNAPFQLDEILRNLYQLFAHSVQQKSLKLYFITDPNIPNQLVGDGLRLQQILSNFLSNASKFTEHGHIILQVSLLNQTSLSVTLDFKVIDTGVGISRENQHKLFQAFSQEEVDTFNKYGGTGLGLAISKKLVDLMGGSISFESKKDQGSTFGIELPFKYQPSDTDKQDLHEFSKSQILVVEADDLLRKQLSSVLQYLHLSFSVVENLQQADQELAENSYDFVLLSDAQEFNSAVSFGAAKIIRISSPLNQSAEHENKNRQAQTLLQQPFTCSALRYSLIGNTQEMLITQTPSLKHNNSGLIALLVEDNEINQIVAQNALEKLGLKVELVKNGQQAVEAAKQNPFDIILMDIQMPVMDGYTASKQIRQFDQKTPIIALSAANKPQDSSKLDECGINDYLSKPINLGKLQNIIAELTGSTIEIENTKSTGQLPQITGFDGDALINRLHINPKTILTMLKRFCESYRNIEQEIQDLNNPSDELANYIHKLKGISANLGLLKIHELAIDCEQDNFAEDSLLALIAASQEMVRKIEAAL